MPAPNPDELLRTIDHAPAPQPAAPGNDRSPSGADTLAQSPGAVALPAEARTLPPTPAPDVGAPPTRTPDAAPGAGEAGPAPRGVAVPGYEVLALLGKGGMGVVYKARQVALGRTVALKMILHAEHAGAEERQRFKTEAEAVARLQHPNIIQVYEVGEHGGVPFFSLEFCGGGSLADRLD